MSGRSKSASTAARRGCSTSVWADTVPTLPLDFNDFEVAAKESVAAYEAGQLRSFIRHARVSEEQVAAFWDRVEQLIHDFDRLPRSGETVYGFTVGAYPMPEYPTLPPPSDEED